MPIDEVRIKAVRGIRSELRLEFAGRSLLIHGDNGTGKSSIVRALQWALRRQEGPSGKAPYTDEEGFRAHVLEPASSPLVRVKLTGGAVIQVTPAGEQVDSAAAPYRDGCVRANPFLHRSQLVAVLNDRPVDRFRYLEGFLDLDQADKIRDVFAGSAQSAQQAAKSAKDQRERKIRDLINLLPAERRPLASTWEAFLRNLSDFAASLRLTEGPSASLEELLLTASKARQLGEGEELAKRRAQLNAADKPLEGVARELTRGLPDLKATSDHLAALAASAADASLSDLLEHARRHLAASKPGTCPVCGQQVDASALLAQITQRLEQLKGYKAQSARLAQETTRWANAWTSLTPQMRQTAEALGVPAISTMAGAPRPPAGLDAFINAVSSGNEITAAILAIGPAALVDWLREIVRFAQARVAEQISTLPPEGSTADIKLFARIIEQVVKDRSEIDRLQDDLSKENRSARAFAELADAVRKARQDMAQELLDKISTNVVEYYRKIHPRDAEGEVTDAPSIEVQRRGAGIAFVRGQFDGKRVEDPRWVYSDGHLDTVGICIFLAMRRFRAELAGDPKLMVLDDIVLSIDLSHARRFLDVLGQDFADHQIILLTHDALFAHWCVSRLPKFDRYSITGWTLEGGPRIGDYPMAIEGLKARYPTETSPKRIAMDIMALMDEWLAEARFAFALSVPAKRGEQYTMSEIWDVFVNSLKKMQTALKTPLDHLTKLLDALKDLPKVRNSLAAHENEFAREFPLKVMRELAVNSIDLVSTLYCLQCRSFAVPVPNRQEPVMVHCKCMKVRYTMPETV